MAESSSRAQRFTVDAGEEGGRLDRFLAARLPQLSRTRIQQQISKGLVRVDGGPASPSRRLRTGESVEIEVPAPLSAEATPEAIPIDVLYEDEDFLAVNKPAGIVVHPGAGITSGTLVNAILHRYGALSTIGGPDRPGIVHRLDKGTSGVLIVARNNRAHQRLARQFQKRRVQKTYVALVHGCLEHDTGRIELAVARDLRRRTRMTTRRPEGRAALTTWRVLARLGPSASGDRNRAFTLIEANIHTGRTHQIRVHFSALGHPVVGDSLYGAPRRIPLEGAELGPPARPWLHAASIRLEHPRTGEPVEIRAPLPAQLAKWARGLAARLAGADTEIDPVLRPYL